MAIGSGAFRAPGIVAAQLGSPLAMIATWVVGGLFILISGLVSAELATRFPKAGGEYVFLREAYGDFAAFFFGWVYTVFIIGGGAGTIAAASGESACELLGLSQEYSGRIGAAAIVSITLVNVLGLKAGAGLQNFLTGTKILAIVGVALVAFFRGASGTEWLAPAAPPAGTALHVAWVVAAVPVLFAYEGTTDSIKMAEEITDVRRDLPRALIGSALMLTLLYVGLNIAFLAVLTPAEMATSRFVASDVMERVFGASGRSVMSALQLLVFLGALSATILATVRVTFALARDGLTFRFMGRMSKGQAPVAALLVVCSIATVFTLFRDFQGILSIYFLAASILFGLAYGSLIVFRMRDKAAGRPFPATAFHCPAGPLMASVLILFQLYLAWEIIAGSSESGYRDPIATGVMLVVFALLYLVWKAADKKSPA